ncbi:MAG: ComF family protein [Streptococcaceae bacterium]|jgi:competence protein ComFC|nr:ComF family protein [Streptococcaceae bacterium]
MKCPLCEQEFLATYTIREVFFGRSPYPLCVACRESFVKKSDPACPNCAKSGETGTCADCKRWKLEYPNRHFDHHALFEYNDAMHLYFSRYKFFGELHLSHAFKQELLLALKHEKALLIPIPISRTTLRRRGFNQVEELLKSSGLPYIHALRKKETPRAQSELTRKERMTAPNPFFLLEECGSKLADRHLLLIDDVYTTGRTLNHARDILETAHPASIRTFSLAR